MSSQPAESAPKRCHPTAASTKPRIPGRRWPVRGARLRRCGGGLKLPCSDARQAWRRRRAASAPMPASSSARLCGSGTAVVGAASIDTPSMSAKCRYGFWSFQKRTVLELPRGGEAEAALRPGADLRGALGGGDVLQPGAVDGDAHDASAVAAGVGAVAGPERDVVALPCNGRHGLLDAAALQIDVVGQVDHHPAVGCGVGRVAGSVVVLDADGARRSLRADAQDEGAAGRSGRALHASSTAATSTTRAMASRWQASRRGVRSGRLGRGFPPQRQPPIGRFTPDRTRRPRCARGSTPARPCASRSAPPRAERSRSPRRGRRLRPGGPRRRR